MSSDTQTIRRAEIKFIAISVAFWLSLLGLLAFARHISDKNIIVPMIAADQIIADSEEVFEEYQSGVIKYVCDAYENDVSVQLDTHDVSTIKVFITVGPSANSQATLTYHYEKGMWKAIDHTWPTGNDYATAPAMIRVA